MTRMHMDGPATGLILVASALMTIGVVFLSSTAADLEQSVIASEWWRVAFVRQGVFAACGVAIMLAAAMVGPNLLRWRAGSAVQPALVLLIISVGLLVCVWVPGIGVQSHGKHRWVSFGSVGLQPSEVVKFAMVGFLASWLCRKPALRVGETPDLTCPMVVIALICALVGSEDFGTAVLLATVGGLMLLVRGCPLTVLAAWTVPVVGAFTFLVVSQPYRIERLLGFLHIWDDPLGAGYHPIQSLAAISSGGWTGHGLGAGLAKYGYLPESRSDFVFSIICEESGFFGGALVILLFVVLAILGLRTMRMAKTGDGGFGRLFAFGVTAMITLQALMNIAVVTVVAPTKGISLPLVSAGGSGIVCFCAAIGLLAGVPRRYASASYTTEQTTWWAQPGLLSGVRQ